MNANSIATFVKTHKKTLAQKALIGGGVAVGLFLVLAETSRQGELIAEAIDENSTDELELDIPEDPTVED